MFHIKPLLVILLSLSLAFFVSSTWSGDGERKISLSGNLQTELNGRISVKALESHFTLLNIESYNPWEKETAKHTGILLNELVAKFAQADTQVVIFSAIDDYEVEIPRAMWESFRILIVTKQNGQYLPVSKRGPMRIVFPDYDASKKEYEINLPLWMWMINKIEFK